MSSSAQPAMEAMLDNLPWHALSGAQAHLAEGLGLALRFPRKVSIFSGAENLGPTGWAALAEMAGSGRAVVLFQARIGTVPEGFDEIARYPTHQMVADGQVEATLHPAGDVEIIELGADDAAEMVTLTALTEPGPFLDETYRLGTYLGVRENGRLIAMAGERLQTKTVSEISAVCTHPDARRRGLAAKLTRAMMDVIEGRGQMPLLHVAKSNTPAIAVYEQLGFRVRAEVEGVAVRVL